MRPIENWIWLPESRYPDYQITRHSSLVYNIVSPYTVAEFTRTYETGKPIAEVRLRFSGDTVYRLYLGGNLLACGPASAGGDFLYNDQPRHNYYACRMTLNKEETPALAELLQAGVLAFRAEVQLTPVKMFELSRGHGGFMLTAEVTFADGTEAILLTDGTWHARRMTEYYAPVYFDNRLPEDEGTNAEVTVNRWYCEDAPIPPCTEEVIIPENNTFEVPAGELVCVDLPLDKIYAGYLSYTVDLPDCTATVHTDTYETDQNSSYDDLILKAGRTEYRSFALCSIGGLKIAAQNCGTRTMRVTVRVIAAHYPTPMRAKTVTSDDDLNLVTEVCTHTLKYCRQTLHLDSPRHCEPLACTGDYYIESLMTAFTYGDLRLARFDVRRTAELLRYHDGRMFHTSYSLIWVQMLWDMYRYTGDKTLLSDCEDALTLLLARFSTYLGENGLLETSPDYMFIDWLNPDGINLHHPPKALGQTCLCMFYFGALQTASLIYHALGKTAMSQKQARDAQTLKQAVLENLYDKEKGLFFEGLNTPTDERLLAEYMPQNVEKRYYRRHANILAAYVGFFDRERCQALLRRVQSDETLGEVQPYFMHFWLDAIYKNGLRGECTMPLLNLWKAPVRECPKGLPEGFYKPTPTYRFDHSHAWGGTPAYALPLALSGLEILEPGFKKIRLNPALLGLSSAHTEIPTPHGMITIDQKESAAPVIRVPDGVTVL